MYQGSPRFPVFRALSRSLHRHSSVWGTGTRETEVRLDGWCEIKTTFNKFYWARMVQTDLSAAFDRVDHLGILYKLCSVGIGRSVLSISTQFL